MSFSLTTKEERLLRAAAEGRVQEVMQAFDAGACRPEYFAEAMVFAASHRREPVVEALLDAGVDPDSRGRWNKTALELAAGERHRSMVRLLLRKGATDTVCAAALLAESPDGELHLAARLGDRARLHAALAAGANVESQSVNGDGTALEIASRRSHARFVNDLLNAESDGHRHRDLTKQKAYRAASMGPLSFQGWQQPPGLLFRLRQHANRLLILLLLRRYSEVAQPKSTFVDRLDLASSRDDLDDALLRIAEESRAARSRKVNATLPTSSNTSSNSST